MKPTNAPSYGYGFERHVSQGHRRRFHEFWDRRALDRSIGSAG